MFPCFPLHPATLLLAPGPRRCPCASGGRRAGSDLVPAVDLALERLRIGIPRFDLPDEAGNLVAIGRKIAPGDGEVVDGEGGGRQAGREGHDLRVTVAEHPLVDVLVQRGVVGGVLDRRCWEAERRRNRDDLPPEVPHDRGRSVLALLLMPGTRGATLPLAFEEPARLAGRDGDG